MTKTPTAIWRGSFVLFGVEVKCHTLDDGQRIIEAESLYDLIQAIANPGTDIDVEQVKAFAEWRNGGKVEGQG